MFSLWRQSAPLCKHIAVWAVFCQLPYACLGSIWLRLRRSMLPTLWHEVLLKSEFILWICCCSGVFSSSHYLSPSFTCLCADEQLNMFCHKYVLWWAHVCRCGAWIVSKVCQIKTFFWLFVPNASPWFSVENGWVGGTFRAYYVGHKAIRCI